MWGTGRCGGQIGVSPDVGRASIPDDDRERDDRSRDPERQLPMETTIDEIAPDIFRLSTLVPEVAPGGFSFNQFLVRDDQPFLFHTGMRQLYPLVSAAVKEIIDIADLRWISFGHVEA